MLSCVSVPSQHVLSLHNLAFFGQQFLSLNFGDPCSRRRWESAVPDWVDRRTKRHSRGVCYSDWVSSLNDNSKLGNAKRLSINGHDNDVRNNKNRMMDVKLGMTLMMKLL